VIRRGAPEHELVRLTQEVGARELHFTTARVWWSAPS
jgi:hypothetical protein